MGKYNFAVMKNTQPMKYDIFISYSRRDLDEVTALVEMLKARIPAIEIWMDLDGIEAADEFDEKIITAIDASSYVLFMVSNNSNSVGEGSSKWTKKELVYAKNTGKTVLPVLLKGALLNSWFLFEFGRVNFIDSNDSRQIDKFLKNLARWTGKELLKEQKTELRKELSSDEQLLLNEAEKIKMRVGKVKRFALILISTAIVILLIGSIVCIGKKYNDISRERNWNYKIIYDSSSPEVQINGSILRTKDNLLFGQFIIPSNLQIDGALCIPVKSIGDGAFDSSYGLKSIWIPNSVTKMGDAVFSGCKELESIRIPDGVINIGDKMFYACTSLKSIHLPKKLSRIGRESFYCCYSLNSITIPPRVTHIGLSAFHYCTALTKIVIPSSVTSIDIMVFVGCDSLGSIVVDNKNRQYDSRENCNAIIETATNTLIAGCKNTIIPNSITSIGEFAFAACVRLKSIYIPSSVTSICSAAFRSCTSLNQINFGGTMAEWHNISKGYGWNSFVPAKTVHCADGDVTL